MATIEVVPLETWRRLFDTAEAPRSLKDNGFDHADIVKAFATETLSDPLLDALQFVFDLANEAGVDAVLDAARARQISVSVLGATTNPAAFIIDLWCRQDGDPRIITVLKLAQLSSRKRSGPSKALREFVGAKACDYPPHGSTEAKVRQQIDDVLRGADLGPALDLLVERVGKRVTHLVVYPGREQEHLLATATGRAPRRMRFVLCDVIQYDPRDARLSISTRSRGLVGPYQRAMGIALADDPSFFDGDALWSLDVIQTKGPSRLDQHGMTREVSSVIADRVLWRHDDNNRAEFDGEDCFAMLDRHPWREVGQLLELDATLHLWGTRSNRVRVTVKVPNRLVVRPERHRPLVERFMHGVGLRFQPRQPLDLWSVSEGVHSSEDVAEGMGTGVEALEQSEMVLGVVRSTRAGERSGPRERLELIDERGALLVASMSDDDTRPSEVLAPEQTDGWRVDVDALARRLALDLGLSPRVRATALGGFFDLGSRLCEGRSVRVFLAAMPGVSEGAHDFEIEAARRDGSLVAVVVPAGRRVGSAAAHVEWTLWAPPFDAAWSRVAQALDLAVDDPWAGAAPGTMILIHRKSQRARINGVEIAFRGDQEFLFLLALAQQPRDKPLTTKKLAVTLTSDPDATAHAAYMVKKRAMESIAQSMRNASVVFPTARLNGLFVSVKQQGGGCRFDVPYQVL